MTDTDEEVREAAAQVATALRGRPRRPHAATLKTLISSPSFTYALSQLLITLREAPDRIDDLVVQTTKRFLDLHAAEASNISTAAAGHAPEIGRLVMRAYTQASDRSARAGILDLVDGLLQSSTYNMAELIEAAER